MTSAASTGAVAIPAIQQHSRLRVPAAERRSWLRTHLTDEWSIVVLAALLSIGFFVWYYVHGETSAFNDARLREMIARRVVDGRTPGLGQLGTTWLPLPSLLMLPLVWNDVLFRSGIAGSLPSMLGYVVASLYMYRIARLLTSSRGAGWVAAAALMLNPSLLYMQSTAMSETLSLSAFVVAIYYALRLTHTNHAADIAKCSAAAAAGTLIRYEDWVLAIALLPILAYAGWRHRGYVMAESWAILYGLLAFAGCAAWVLYNAVIFHDPLLSFFYGQSSHTYYANTPASMLPARHHAGVAFTTYAVTVAGTVGWAAIGVAMLGLLAFIWRGRIRHPMLPVYLTLIPFAFYWLALYTGVNTEWLPSNGMRMPLYNLRFGLAMIPAVGLFSAFAAAASPARLRGVAVGALLAMTVAYVVYGTVGQTPFVLREALYGSAGAPLEAGGKAQANWLSSNYHRGQILITYTNSQTTIFYLLTSHDLSDDALITDTNGRQFRAALAHPQDWVKWIVMNSDASSGDSRIWTTLHGRQDWRRFFVLRKVFGTTQIYQRVPTRATASAGPLRRAPSVSSAPPQRLDDDES